MKKLMLALPLGFLVMACKGSVSPSVVSEITQLSIDQVQCLENSNAPDAGAAILQCLPGLALDPNLISLIGQLLEQKKAAERGERYVWSEHVVRKDGGK